MNNLYNAQLINDKNTLDTLCFLLKIDKKLFLVMPNNNANFKKILISKFSVNFLFDIKEENISRTKDLVYVYIDCVYFDKNDILKDNRPQFLISDMHKLVYTTKENFEYTQKKENCFVNILENGIDKTIPFKKVPFSLLTKENKVYGIVIGDKVVELWKSSYKLCKNFFINYFAYNFILYKKKYKFLKEPSFFTFYTLLILYTNFLLISLT